MNDEIRANLRRFAIAARLWCAEGSFSRNSGDDEEKLTSDDLHDAEVLAHCPWFSMRKGWGLIWPGDRRDFCSYSLPAPGGRDCGDAG